MPFGANQYYTDPTIGRAASNLGAAIFGDPEARLKRGLYDAQAGYYGAEADKNRADTDRLRAETGKLNAETTGLGITNTARTRLGDAISRISAPLPGENPQQTIERNAPAIGDYMAAYPGTAEQGAAALRTHLSTLFGVGDADQQRRSLILDGKMPDQNFSPTGTIADANATRNSTLKTNEDVAKEAEANRGAADRNIYTQGQENKRNDVNEAGRNSRFYNTPITLAPNAEAFLPKANPNFAQFGERLYGRTDTSAAGKPAEVQAKDLEDVIFSAAQQIPGATMPDPTKPGNTIINPGFEAQFPPQQVIQARTAAATEYQTTRNAQSAVAVYMRGLGIAPGSTFTPPNKGWFSSTPGAIVPPVGAAPQAGGPPAADPISDARAAIAKGAPRAAVIQRLQQAKIPVPPDL